MEVKRERKLRSYILLKCSRQTSQLKNPVTNEWIPSKHCWLVGKGGRSPQFSETKWKSLHSAHVYPPHVRYAGPTALPELPGFEGWMCMGRRISVLASLVSEGTKPLYMGVIDLTTPKPGPRFHSLQILSNSAAVIAPWTAMRCWSSPNAFRAFSNGKARDNTVRNSCSRFPSSVLRTCLAPKITSSNVYTTAAVASASR
mmetsp:Transcript_7274/g.17726  ORF Transcript_7274/g.17726 Transcript_7274/m.17726 type:complete len:200 (+) Transcript_7274:779-1378(+)